jgi:hypothetical protein
MFHFHDGIIHFLMLKYKRMLGRIHCPSDGMSLPIASHGFAPVGHADQNMEKMPFAPESTTQFNFRRFPPWKYRITVLIAVPGMVASLIVIDDRVKEIRKKDK